MSDADRKNELVARIQELEAEAALLRRRVAELEGSPGELEGSPGELEGSSGEAPAWDNAITVEDIRITWDPARGACEFEALPVAMMWIDTTLAGLMSGVQTMVGTQRFGLSLQSEGRKSVEADWQVVAQFESFEDGFAAIARIGGVAGWGRWELVRRDDEQKTCEFRIHGSWEGLYQKTLGVCWGSGMLAGKLAGYCSRLYETNCWATQTAHIAKGDPFDAFVVQPSMRSLESEIENLLSTDAATKADMAVALQKLGNEIESRRQVEEALRSAQAELEMRVAERTAELAEANVRLKSEVAERRRAEQDLKRSESRFRSLFESSPMGICLYQLEDDDRLILRAVNPKAEVILGIDGAELVGKTLEEAFPPLAQTELPLRYREVCRTGQAWSTEQVDYVDERVRGAYEVHAFESLPNTVAVLFSDITERLQAADEREALKDRLHRALRMEALGLLAGGVAHDLNNVLSGIVSYPDVLLEELAPDSPLRQDVLFIQAAGERAAAIVRDLLTIARGVASEKRPRDINRIVIDFMASLEFKGLHDAHPTVEIHSDLHGALLNVECSAVHMRKSLMNLVLNAVEASPEGGQVRVSTRNQYVDKPLRGYDDVRIGEYVVVSVTDGGPGIPPDALGRIFEPFYTRKLGRRSGTGLGLAVVWTTLQDHDGYVDVTSSAQGTRFDLYLPATREDVSHAAESQPITAFSGNGERILVVDDEERQRFIASRMLIRLGYECVTVASGEEAIRAVQEQPFDLILLDMIMPPGIDGRETYEMVIALRPGQKAIIASGYSRTEDVTRAQALGAGAYLRKPYSLEELGTAVRDELT